MEFLRCVGIAVLKLGAVKMFEACIMIWVPGSQQEPMEGGEDYCTNSCYVGKAGA